MNQELKHRLIGAAVITALAAIFIPMLFDDPIDDTGKLVSGLTIPAEPEATANKAPASVDQVLATTADQSGNASQNEQASPSGPEAGAEASVADDSGGAGSDNNAGQIDNGDLQQIEGAETADAGTDSYVEEEMQPEQGGQDSGVQTQTQAQQSALNSSGSVEQNPQSSTAAKIAEEPEAYQQPSAAKPAEPDKSSSSGNKTQAKKIAGEVPVKPASGKPTVMKPPVSAAAGEMPKAVGKTGVSTKKTSTDLKRWYLQVGSFGRKENALTLFDSLKKQGLPVLLEAVQGEKGALYRLKVGPELSKKRAVDIKSKLENQKINTMLISE